MIKQLTAVLYNAFRQPIHHRIGRLTVLAVFLALTFVWSAAVYITYNVEKPMAGKFALLSFLFVILVTGFVRVAIILYEGRESREHLERQALTDTLTGLYNRRGFDDNVDRWMTEHLNSFAAIALLDIDNFKQINDRFGHPFGDRILIYLSRNMEAFFGEQAILGRNGGDEFILLLKYVTEEQADETLRAFAGQVSPFVSEERRLPFTVSIGYSAGPGSRREMTRMADKALYTVKLNGRNGVECYNSERDEEERSQLGFALKDFDLYMPGGLLIMNVTEGKRKLLFANQAAVKLHGFDSLKELLAYASENPTSLVYEEDFAKIDPYGNNRLFLRIRDKHGRLKNVLFLSRFHHNEYYGDMSFITEIPLDYEHQEG